MDYSHPHSLPLALPQYFWIPERVSLEGGDLVWDWGTPRLVNECGDVLGTLTQLAGGELGRPSSDTVLRIARQYGPLYAHSRPLGNEDSEPWRESIDDWYKVAQRVQATAEVARRLGDKVVSRDDLNSLADPGFFEVLFLAQQTETDPVRISDLARSKLSRVEFERHRKRQARWEDGESARGTVEEGAKRTVRACVDALLHGARAQVQLEWTEDDRPRVALHGSSFLAVVAGQLICAVYGGQVAVCHACGAAITSGRKRPKGQRAFCDDECSAAFNKVRKRDERATEGT